MTKKTVVLILILLEVTLGDNELLPVSLDLAIVLILILLEVTLGANEFTEALLEWCLNPYSTGSDSWSYISFVIN